MGGIQAYKYANVKVLIDREHLMMQEREGSNVLE